MKKLGKFCWLSAVLLADGHHFHHRLAAFHRPQGQSHHQPSFERTPERLARGRYLVVGLAGCEVCHSPKDWKTHGAPNLPGMELAGQVIAVPDFPGIGGSPEPDARSGNRRAQLERRPNCACHPRRRRPRWAHDFSHDALQVYRTSFRRGCGLHRGLSAFARAGAKSAAADPS